MALDLVGITLIIIRDSCYHVSKGPSSVDPRDQVQSVPRDKRDSGLEAHCSLINRKTIRNVRLHPKVLILIGPQVPSSTDPRDQFQSVSRDKCDLGLEVPCPLINHKTVRNVRLRPKVLSLIDPEVPSSADPRDQFQSIPRDEHDLGLEVPCPLINHKTVRNVRFRPKVLILIGSRVKGFHNQNHWVVGPSYKPLKTVSVVDQRVVDPVNHDARPNVTTDSLQFTQVTRDT
ncbi:hypothetical protein Q3G72_006142 [Acer saccharum]|nr:hypothetical protein Q3G72_006142 [Acer saccharum]